MNISTPRQDSDLPRLVAAAVIVMIEVVYIAEALSRPVATIAADSSRSLAVIVTLGLAARLAGLVLAARFDFARASYYLFTFVWMGLSPLMQLTVGQGPLAYSFDPQGYGNSLLLVAVGTIGYEIGSALGDRTHLQTISLRSVTLAPVHKPRLRILTVVLLATVLVALTISGGPAILFTSRSEFSTAVFGSGDSKATGAVINALLIVPPLALTMLWIDCMRRKQFHGPFDVILATLAFASNIVINNPLAQSRFWFATVLVSALAAILPYRDTVYRVLTTGSLLFLVVVFPFSDVFRYSSANASFTFGDPFTELATKGDFDAFQQLSQTLSYVQDNGLALGKQALSAVLFFVPRSLWPSKGLDTGTLLGTSGGLGNVNLSAPIWAEGYVDFGVLGCVGYCLVIGYVFKRIANSTLRTLPAALGLIGVYQFVLLRGSLLQSMGITAALLLVFAAALATRRSPREHPVLETLSPVIHGRRGF